MALVTFEIGKDTTDGVALNAGTIVATPTRRRVDGTVVVARNSVSTEFCREAVSLELPSTPLGVAMKIVVDSNHAEPIDGYFKIPNVETISFSKLIEVDPETLETGEPEPEWWAVANATVNSGKVVGDHLILTRTDGVEIDAGNVRGLPGQDGKGGEDGRNGLNGLNGKAGVDGVGVVYTEIDANGDLLVTLSNDQVVNAGHVKGEDGVDGVDGVDGSNGIINLATNLPAETLPTTFPEGLSAFVVSTQAGWPVGNCKVLTHRRGTRIAQEIISITNEMFTRSSNSDIWTSFARKTSGRQIGLHARDYGVTGDGVTNDSPACNAAVVAAVAAGLPLIFEKKMIVRLDSTFEIVEGAIIHTNDCQFIGVVETGRNSKINVRSNVKIYGTLKVQTPGGLNGMGVIVYGSNVYIEDVRVTSLVPGMGVGNSRDNGVRVDNAQNVTFGRVYIKNFEWSFSGENSNNLTIGYIEIDNYSRGLHMNDCNNARVGGGNIYGISPNASYLPGYNGVLIGNDDVLRTVHINDVTVRDAQEHGFRIGGPNESIDVYFKNCVSINSVGSGFKCLGSIQAEQIFNKNIVYDNCISEDSGLVNQNTNGFLLQMIDGLTMINPIVRTRNNVSSGYAGIRLGGANNVVITNPMIINANQYGIHIDSDLGDNNDISITGAKILQASGWMIYVSNGTAHGLTTTFSNISIEAEIRATSDLTNGVYMGRRSGETQGLWDGINYLDLKVNNNANPTRPAIGPTSTVEARSKTFLKMVARLDSDSPLFMNGSEWTDLSQGKKFLAKAGVWVEQ